MKGDFSRSTFDPLKHYRGVRMQQGRVQLDSDWNENLDILLHRIETETIDVIGECGVPIHDAGFGVVTGSSQKEKNWLTEQGLNPPGKGDFYLTAGRAYVDGIQVENDQPLLFSQQPFILPKGQAQTNADGVYLLYLDVWERHLTVIEDPAIREVALGGPDTATRTQVIWQAMLENVGNVNDNLTCADDLTPWPDPSTGKLSARTQPADKPDDPCAVPPGVGYKRLENQLYRVEIHQGGSLADKPTFKWSRDNGSVVVSVADFIIESGNVTKIQTTSLGRDDMLGLHENDWIEVLDDATELAGKPGTLVQISKIDPDNILTINPSIPDGTYDKDGHPKVRRWDVNETQTKGDIPLTEGAYIALEGGVEIQFETGGTYRTGDYWLIPARTIPGQYGEIEWPEEGDNPVALLAFGITHYYCKLALLTFSGSTITDVEDCRKKFPPLTELPTGGQCCCSVSVGEGGDHPDLKAALEARPPDAAEWRICLLAGKHKLDDTITIEDAQGLTISGCSQQTRVIGPPEKPAFVFSKGNGIQLDNLWLEASSPDGAILFKETRSVVVRNCVLANKVTQTSADLTTGEAQKLGSPGPLIIINNAEQVEIRENNLLGLPAVMADGLDISIARNRIRSGGIQIMPPASIIRIGDNVIFDGQGPGIRLGGDEIAADSAVLIDRAEATDTGTPPPAAKSPLTGILLATIDHNLISDMAGSGIVTQTAIQDPARAKGHSQMIDVEYLIIKDNQIISCCQTPDISLSAETQVGGGIALVGVFNTQIANNFIAKNGRDDTPACGVFLLEGSDIDLENNVIVENGIAKDQGKPEAYQAGIAAQLVFGNFLGAESSSAGAVDYPALRIRDNEVVCPAGQALSVSALGGVMVDGNTLVTRGHKQQPLAPFNFGERGVCVYILDLGIPLWLKDL